jgi:hypothetical protein
VKWIGIYLVLAFIQAETACAVGNIQSGFIEFDQVPPPLSVTWQLATATGESVSATWSGLQPSNVQQLTITEENAAEFGVDFSAWAQAVVNPTYNRSIVTANGVSHEGQLLRFGDVQTLDSISFLVDDYFWPPRIGSPQFGVNILAVEQEIVPEPTTWVFMVCIGLFCLFARVLRRP